MTGNFDKWTDRIAAANDDASRRAVLAEIGAWRAAKLTDVTASRQATFAMSRLYALLGDHAGAVREAHSLVSLCQTPPEASRDETASARAYLGSLGEKVPREIRVKQNREPRSKRTRSEGKREPKRERQSAYGSAMAAAREGKWGDGLRAMRGKSGQRADLVRTWLHLSRALEKDDAEARLSDLRDLEKRLRKVLDIDGRKQAPEERAKTEAAQSLDDPLSQILGIRAPRRREMLVRALEKHAQEHPEELDKLAAAALRHHLSFQGEKRAAPWLISTVAHALAATDGVATATAIDALRTAGAFAVSAYDEAPFTALLGILGKALEGQWTYRGLRRGVSRDEPRDRRMWTLRLAKGRTERLLVRADDIAEPYADGVIEVLVPRLLDLCTRVVLHAPGAGNEALRDAAAQAGIAVIGTDDAALQAMADVHAAVPDPAPESAADAPPRKKKPALVLEELLMRDEPATVDEIVAVLGDFRRWFQSFQVAEKLFGQIESDRIATLLDAVHSTADTDRRIPSGSGLAVRAAARSGVDSRVHSMLVEGPTAVRYGGAGIADVVAIYAALQSEGWDLHRLLKGPTRRERDDAPAVDALAEHLGGLWRLVVRKGDVRGEIWYVAGLPAEGRAAVPQLLLRDAHRAVILPIDPDLLSWYGTLGGPSAIGWTGSEGDEVLAAVTAWPSPAPENP